MGLIIARIACLAISVLLFWKAYLFSPWHEPFPFGNYMCSALAWAGILFLWAGFRVHKPFERKAIAIGIVTGLILGWLFSRAGILFEMAFGRENLSPMAGIFVGGPLGFIIGTIGGVAATFFRRRLSKRKGVGANT